MRRMHDDAGGVLQQREIAGKAVLRGDDALCSAAVVLAIAQCQRGIAVCMVQRIAPDARAALFPFVRLQHAADEKIVQHQHAGMASHQIEHVAVEWAVADLVQDAVEAIGMLREPGCRLQGQIGQSRWQGVVGLVGDQRDVVMVAQGRQQLGAVVGNAGARGRQRRYERQRFLCRRHGAGLVRQLPLGVHGFHGRNAAPRTEVPGKHPGLVQTVCFQFGAIGVVAQHLRDLVGHGALAPGVEQRIGPADDFRQAGRVRRNGGPAAGHRFQDGQTETLVPGRHDEQCAEIVELDQVLVGREAGQDHLARQQVVLAGYTFEARPFGRLKVAHDQQLMGPAQVFGQQRVGGDQALDMLAAVGGTRVHDERLADAVLCQHRLFFFLAHLQWLEMRVGGGRDVDHLVFGIVDQLDRFAARGFRNRQQQIGTAHVFELARIVLRIRRIGPEIVLGIDQRNQVVKRDCDGRVPVEAAYARDGIVAIAFDQAGYVDEVRPQAGEEGFAHQFGGVAVCRRARVAITHRPGCVPDADVLRRQQLGKIAPERHDGFVQQAVQGQDDFMLAAPAHDGFDQRHRIAPDAARAAGTLRALHIDDDAHQNASLLRVEVFSETACRS